MAGAQHVESIIINKRFALAKAARSRGGWHGAGGSISANKRAASRQHRSISWRGKWRQWRRPSRRQPAAWPCRRHGTAPSAWRRQYWPGTAHGGGGVMRNMWRWRIGPTAAAAAAGENWLWQSGSSSQQPAASIIVKAAAAATPVAAASGAAAYHAAYRRQTCGSGSGWRRRKLKSRGNGHRRQYQLAA